MARISTYNLDNTVSKNDKVIGTDSSGSSTKNFRLENIADFLNTSNILNVNGQIVYQAPITASELIIDKNDIGTGVYFVQVATANGIIHHTKIVFQ